LISASLQSLPEQACLQVFTSRFFPTVLFVRVYNSLHNTSTLHRTVYPQDHSFSQVSAFRSLHYFAFICSILSLTQNAFLHKTLSSTLPHSCSRRRPASTSSERLVRSVHSRQMLLGCACRVWCLGIGANCQSVLHLYQHVAFPYPSLTSYTYACIVGPCQRNFGHYPCRWLANYDEMQPD
jgi:hypothetical protein